MFEASSRSGGAHTDGAHAVHCYLCKAVICRTAEPITRALCALCEAGESGKDLTDEALTQYQAQRGVLNGVSMLTLQETPVVVPGDKKKFSLTSVGEGAARAIGFLRRKPEVPGPSQKLAQSKRRGRLLEGLTEADVEIGSMFDIDSMLKKDGSDR